MAGAGLKLALPLFWTPPCTSITEAVTWALPLAEMAVDELESTTIAPGILMLALPERVRAPPADGSRTKIEGATVIVKVWTRSHAVAAAGDRIGGRDRHRVGARKRRTHEIGCRAPGRRGVEIGVSRAVAPVDVHRPGLGVRDRIRQRHPG